MPCGAEASASTSNRTRLCPARTPTVEGTANPPLLLAIAIEAVDPAGTAFVRLTVQVVEPAAPKTLWAQVIEDGAAGAVNERAVIATDPLKDAMRVMLWSDVIEPTLTEKLAEAAFWGTTAEAGIVRTLLTEAEIATEVPPTGAALDKVTVQVVAPLDVSPATAQCREEIRGRVAKAMVALVVVPLREAVTVALWFDLNCPAFTVNVPALDPAPISSEFTAVAIPPVAPRLMFAPPEPAGPLRVTVQVVEPPGPKTLWAQVIEDGATGAVNEMAVMATDPLKDAMRVMLWSDVIEPTLTEKLAEAAFWGTTAEAGIVRTLLTEAEIATEVPPTGAALDKVTVQVVAPLDVSPATAHCREEIRGRVAKAIVALVVVPLREAVTVALWFDLNCPAFTVNVPALDPAPINSEFTAVAIPPVAPRLTFAPPAPAGPLRVTVQVAEAPGPSEAGLQARELIVAATAALICPPVAVIGTAVPLEAAATAPLILIAADPAMVAETVAIRPFAMTFWFGPVATHS